MTLDESNEETIAEMALDMPVRFDAQQRVWLGDEDISLAIRSEEAGMNASRVSALPAVRTALVDLQLSFQALPGLVADGRDMGTVIFPTPRSRSICRHLPSAARSADINS